MSDTEKDAEIARLSGGIHASGCSVHNAPAFPPGPCDCGLELLWSAEAELARQNAANDMLAKERDAWQAKAAELQVHINELGAILREELDREATEQRQRAEAAELELDEMRPNADRYLWLRTVNGKSRNQSPYETDYWVSILFRKCPPSLNGYVTEAYTGDELDAAIDIACERIDNAQRQARMFA